MNQQRTDDVPRVARALVAVVTPPADRAFVLGDLGDEYGRLRAQAGWWAARSWYWRQALAAVRPGLGRRLARRPVSSTDAAGRGTRGMTNVVGDLRYAARRLREAPLVAVVSVVSLGLGIGATTTVFSVVNSLLFKASPAIADPDGVLSIYTVSKDEPVFGQTSFPDFVTLGTDVASLDRVAAVRLGLVSYGNDAPERSVTVEIVTGDFFDVLGVTPALGRVFTRDETRPGQAEHVTVVSHEFWQRTLGGRPDVLGRQIRLDGQLFTIVGVGPEGLKSRLSEMNLAAWVPAGLPGGFYHATDREITNRADRQYSVLARARPGYSVQQVDAELALLASRLHAAHGVEWEDARARPLAFRVVAGNPGLLPPEFRMAFGAAGAIALAGAGVILLIACTNVAGLLLAQAHGRRQEIAVRAALGASRARLVVLLLAESALVALASGGLGVLIARATVASMGSVSLPMGVPLEFDFGLDLRVLLFALGVSAAACLAFGLLPALSGSRAALVPALKAGREGPGGRRLYGLRRLLVVAQVAASLVLLVGAGLVLRSTTNVLHADLGFTPDRIAVVSKDLSFGPSTAPEALVTFRDLAAKIAAHPEVEGVALSTSVERVFDDLTIASVRPDGKTGAGEALLVRLNAVDPGYFGLLAMRLAQGRFLTDADRRGAMHVAVVNEAFAARQWPGQSAVGHTIRFTGIQKDGTSVQRMDDQLTVVGIVRDPAPVTAAESWSELGASTVVGVHSRIWVPLDQYPSTRVVINAKARTTAASIVDVLRREAGTEHVPLIAPQPLAQLISFPMMVQRTVGRVMRWAGAFALVLAFLGIYGIVSFVVSERSREMAIRKAMGARPDQVIRGVMRHGFRLAVWGVVVGFAIAAPLAFLTRSQLAAISPLDPIAFGGGAVVILMAALLASGLPARRLGRLDPMAVLRDE